MLFHGVKQLVTAAVLVCMATAALADDALTGAIGGDNRSELNASRDVARHPEQTLQFFQLAPTDTVVEITPGSGWYTEILAPYLRDAGQLYAAHYPSASDSAYFQRSRKEFMAKLAANPEVYDRVKVTEFVPGNAAAAGPLGAVDKVFTFRNVHNWLKAGDAEVAFRNFYALLAKGGVLGVVEHRAKPGTSLETMKVSGYVTEAEVIRLAQAAGFVLEEKSEINANKRDTKDYPRGVWTLPPTLALKDEAREKYETIGESDRMTLRFRKPE